uniref:Secreted protein n=1 Tax=Strongyloides venezuelensis TaxID=75913 RepID=A0A0K0FS39_STRVS
MYLILGLFSIVVSTPRCGRGDVGVELLLIIVSTEVPESILKIIIYYRRSSFEKKCIPIVKKRKFCKNSITIVYRKIV